MKATIKGYELDLIRDTVISIAKTLEPEPIRKHWVEVEGKKFPPKQLLNEILKKVDVPLERLDFTTMYARDILRKFGFKMGYASQKMPEHALNSLEALRRNILSRLKKERKTIKSGVTLGFLKEVREEALRK